MSHLFEEYKIGSVTLKNRVAMAPMGHVHAADGGVSEQQHAYILERAKGGFGLITIESTVVYEQAKGGPRKPCLFSDSTVESFRQVASA